MSKEAMEEFGKRVVQYVRDWAMGECNLLLRLDREGAGTDRLRTAAAANGGLLPPDTVIPECVDGAAGHVLYAMDDADLLHLSFTTKSEETVDWSVVGGGEPVGWYMGIPGWRKWYSKERIVDSDDFAHIPAKWGVEDDADEPAPILDELSMPRRAIEELGILLVRHVRDVAIQRCDAQLLPQSTTAVAKRWRAAAEPYGGKVPPQILIPDCVDIALTTFLEAIDKGLLRLSFTTENGEIVDLAKEGRGELAAKYPRWRAQWSKDRFAEDEVDDSSGG